MGLSIFGDSAYPSRAGLQAAFKSPQEAGDPGRIKYGDAMSTARGDVEHYFAQVMNQWRGLSMYPGLMPAKQNVGEYVFCAAFLSNCATCANGGSQISDRFLTDLAYLLRLCWNISTIARAEFVVKYT